MYWIEIYGLKGAIYAILVSYATVTYFGNLFTKKTRVNFKLQTVAVLTVYKLKGII